MNKHPAQSKVKRQSKVRHVVGGITRRTISGPKRRHGGGRGK